MGYKSKGGAGKKKGKGSRAPASSACAPPRPPHHNFVADAGPGCVIAHDASPPWALGRERIDPRDYPRDVVFPDLAVNPEDGTLSVVNASSVHRVCYVTVYDHPVLDRDGVAFPSGRAVDDDGKERACVTFILLLPPRVILHAATLSEPTSEIDSDVQDWSRHPDPEDTHPAPLGFPLGGDGPWLCTQGEGGALTHFFSGNLHAVDFRCDVGTDILAVADGEVLEVSQSRSLTGVATSNLYAWNSVMIRCDVDGGDLIVEYVHIKKDSAVVKVGDKVRRGQKVCESGEVGFSPEPHLHFTAFRTRDADAATCRVRFQAVGAQAGDGGPGEENTSEPYVPVAGKYYDARGERPTPGTEADGKDGGGDAGLDA